MNSWFFSTRRVGKHRDPCCDAALHEIRRFECPCAAGIRRYDNDVGVAFWTFSDSCCAGGRRESDHRALPSIRV
jgi:hypothetical protein